MSSDADALAPARAALDAGRWAEAADLARAEAGAGDGEAALLLAVAQWCGYDIPAAIDSMKLAYRRLVDSGRTARAAWVACWLGFEEAGARGNRAVGQGWMRRATRLLEDCPECAEHGWVRLWSAAFEGDHERLAAAAADAEAIARRFGDRELEILSRAERGLALVLLGQVDEGMAMLDEALAAITAGDAREPIVVGDAFCAILTACESVQDYARAEEWCRVGLASESRHPNGFLKANCLASYGWILGVLGQTDEGESRLREALRMFDAGHRAIRGNALVKLADLARRRGALDEATALLDDAGDSTDALCIRVEIALARGDGRVALRLAQRLHAEMAGERDTRRVVSLQLLARAAAPVDIAAARLALIELVDVVRRVDTPAAQAWLAMAEGAVATAAGDADAAAARYTSAASTFSDSGALFDAAEARLAAGRARAPIATPAGLTAREVEVLRLLAAGMSNAGIAAQLHLSPHTVHRHVASVLRKLDVSTRAAAAAAAIRLGV